MSEREKLKIQLLEIVHSNSGNFTLESTYDALADFILADRKRICEPLVNRLEDIHNALDIALGDTDPCFPEDITDKEIMEEDPLFWACKEVETLRKETLKLAALEVDNGN